MSSYIVWNLSPEIFDGLMFFRWYGLSWIAGMFLAYRITSNIYRAEQLAVDEVDTLAMYMVLGVIVGARLGHVLFYDPIYYWNNPIEILPVQIKPTFAFTGLTGLASHGGTIGALLALYFYNRKFKRGYRWFLDRLTIAGAALGGFIRLGNLMNSEIIGTPSTLPWAFIFKRIDNIPRHPTQLYEAVFYFIIAFVLYQLWKSKKFYAHNGFIAGLGIATIFTQRFLIEFLKENQASFENQLVVNMGQVLSIPLILAGVALMIWSRKNSATATIAHAESATRVDLPE